MNEAERQQRLLAALQADDAAGLDGMALRERGPRAQRGLRAYRANADASAERALATAFPTVRQLVGAEDFASLARRHWQAAPPQRGDLGEWGGDFPAALEADPRLADWPYLGDCARLDWALFRCERAADATPDTASVARLGDTDPARLDLVAMPGVAVVASGWPIARIHSAHHDDDAGAFEAARAAIAARVGEAVVVARDGWKGRLRVVDADVASWMQRWLTGCDLGALLNDAGASFDFGAWLALALQHAWLQGIRVRPD